MKDYIIQIKKALGKGNNCLGGTYYFEFSDEKLEEFLKKMHKKDKDKFNKVICNYCIYMESLSFLRDYKIKKDDSAIKYFYHNVWSNIVLSIMFSIIETLIKRKTESPLIYLEKNFDKLKTKRDIDKLYKKWANDNPSIVENIYSFYNDNLSKEDEKSLKNCFSKDFTLKKILKDKLYGETRSKFIHSLSIESLPQYEIGFNKKEGIIELSNELNAERFIYLSWKAILKHFNYKENKN
jgi:hypothetical protein